MSNKLITSEDIAQTLREKVRATYMGLIPDEKIDEFISKEINDFFVNPTDDPQVTVSKEDIGSYPRVEKYTIMFGKPMTPFQMMVHTELVKIAGEEIKDRVKDAIKEIVRGSKDSIITKDQLLEFILTCAPFMVKEMIGNLLSDKDHQMMVFINEIVQQSMRNR